VPTSIEQNAVLGDPELQAGLRGIDPVWGDLCTRVAGEVWGMPLIDQKTKSLLTVAIDVVNGGTEPAPFFAHLDMAMKQGASAEMLHELIVFTSVYAGFNKAAPAMLHLKEFLAGRQGS
jgi:4-carboxymuconolactone decarboxylase